MTETVSHFYLILYVKHHWNNFGPMYLYPEIKGNGGQFYSVNKRTFFFWPCYLYETFLEYFLVPLYFF